MKNKTLMTDFYELTMAQTYFKEGAKDEIAYFDLFFRKNPFQGGYTISGGLEETIDYIQNFHYDEEAISYLRTLGTFDEELLKNYDFLIIKRHTDPLLPLLEKYAGYQDHFILTDIKESSISSTKIREMIYNNKAYQKYLDSAVCSYIKEKNLYRKEERRMDFKEIIHILQKQRKTIATMESCTGGGVVNAITNLKGACEILRFSAVTYSNEFKIKMGVPKEVIDRYTVYSMETAKEMSRAITTFAESDFGVGVTGKLKVEDPNNPGGDDETVYICLYDKEHEKFYQETIKVTEDNKPRNKEQVIHTIIKMLLAILQ